ncbi:UxaA family hydrolase [Bryobacter aggregatus]|uniref:UxaA family hydrolase n=1 Tax=Bryobacter aggregatus TaxID=360054 RepID=UPI0004E11E82|nr:altronate dehydratase family protein [Bryobacter aggregatus]
MGLLDIAKLPTAENSAIRMHESDNVAIARVPLSVGATIVVAGNPVVVRDNIPAGHKVCLTAIAAGSAARRYGQAIGRARVDIAPGQHIHVHNLAFEDHEVGFEFPTREVPYPAPPAIMPTFQGFVREDGRVGTRNYVAVVAASNCAAHTVDWIAESFDPASLPANVDGVVAFPHGEGCGHTIGPDTEQLRRTLAGVLNHPNIGAALIVGLGCEVNQIDHYLGPNAPRSKRLHGLTLQSAGGTRAAVEASRKRIQEFMEEMSAEKRVTVPASKIQLGLNCGGSDSFSGITANPALGVCSDMLAAIGASAVLAETTECFGAEHLLVKRARNREVAEKFLGYINGYKKYLRQFGGSFDDNPSPGNKEGGLSNILEKSLGASAKAGTSPMMDAVDYAETVTSPGFVFMNTPGYDPVSITGLAAGGVNLIAFTTGRGSAIGFPNVPVIKIATNTSTYKRMQDNMDVNAGRIVDGDATVEQVGQEIFDLCLRTASGEKTCAERLGHKEFVPWRIGPVL